MQAQDFQSRILTRLDQPTGGYYTPAEALRAANEGVLLFALLTLGLETTVSFTTDANAPFWHMLSYFPDWLLPLRVSTPAGQKVRPARLQDLDALDSGWQTSTGPAAVRYAGLGFDFFVLYPATQGISVNITYAQAPAPMVAATDTPPFPEQCHPAFVDYGVQRLRFREGGQEFAKALPYLRRFMDEAKSYGNYIRSRSLAARYDKLPFEFERADLSKLLSIRPGLVPARKVQSGQ
jgi:hypothetical protein